MIKINKAIIVEGKYDKIKLSNFIDGVIIETEGFRIFADKEKKALIKHLAEKTGIIILTDSDAAGFKIRNYIRNIAKDENVINVYIPDIFGKEKRKDHPSKEGKLGVEGMTETVLQEAFSKAGIVSDTSENKTKKQITTLDLYNDGLTGTDNAKEKKYMLLSYLGLPSRLSNSQFLKLMNTFMTYEDYEAAVKAVSDS